HALTGRALARGDSRGGTVPLREHPHPRPRGDDEYAAERRVPWIRRAADAVRDRSAHGADRRAAGDGSGEAPREERAQAGRHDGDGPEARRGLQRARGVAGGGEAVGVQAEEGGVRWTANGEWRRAGEGRANGEWRRAKGHWTGAVLSRIGVHRRRR